jgi:glucuronoxylan 4-O-methyltransferase
MRKLNRILLSTQQLKVISETIKKKAPCRLLVFGLGNDSLFWSNINRGGVTIFIEDDKDWFRKITDKSKGIKACLINYGTKRTDWKKYLEDTSLLDTTLPGDIEQEKWDVILVDGPSGWNDETPGRMKSIFLSSRLIKIPGDIFVHDSEREIEDIYSNKFLGKENLQMEYGAQNGFLRHYRFKKK